MLRDFKFSRRNSGKSSNLDEIENIPINPNAAEEQEVGLKITKGYKTPTKSSKSRYSDGGMPLRTPEKRGVPASNRYGWPQKNESSSNATEMGVDLSNYRNGNGGFANMGTPRSSKAAGRGNSSYSECNSNQSTPTKSVNKPPNPGLCLTGGSRPPPASGVARMASFAALSKGIPISSSSSTVVNSVEVPHFAMKEDPSFWMDHNVQVLIRVRPLNSMEKSTYGYNRCLKQESAQCISWVGQPENRFTFDHVACETVDQETLFRIVGLPMVENCLSGYNSCMFAYGQTGSGKTYTMLGNIEELGVKPSINRGMTPRIFEFLFARIRAEEESRRDERLTYNCKCSFLEIYNEQITDLLDPSSTNLQLREDIKTGVYVENLSEFEVQTVDDILKLLSQGSSNRKVAATNMNRESSRSHSVFTCIIESRWEKDSTSNLRFARLNLVDLAGSERQKTSGAEGERLKEAVNINKSLSTLGHVIMVLVDVAHAKTRHVPYRDSRLTFLLQDSLGGNSKTMIIANVSPSICSAAETLNTLKFAQRAKLIQNNAVVNEDSSGDVIALRHQIRLLKEELLALKRQNVSRSLTFGSIIGDGRQEHDSAPKTKALEMDRQSTDDMLGCESKGTLTVSSKQLKSLETTLTGSLRREQLAETSFKQLEAEIEQLNCLVHQREEDNRCTKMMLKFREEKIQRMENLLAGLVPADAYLLEENKALTEEIQHLQAKVDKNPEVTRFALENIRLLEQLRRFQDFYEEGEREMLLTEVSELRDQLVLFLDENFRQHSRPNINLPPKEADMNKENASLHQELKKTLSELECRSNLNSCLENNAISREIDELQAPPNHLKSATHDYDGSVEVIKESILEAPSLDEQLFEAVQQENGELHENLMKHTQEVLDLQLEVDILKVILKEERSSRCDLEEKTLCLTRELELAEGKASLLTIQYNNMEEELREAKSIIEALESQQLISISELEDLRNSSNHYAERLRKQEFEISSLKEQAFGKELRDPASSNLSKFEDSPLQIKLKKMHDSLEKAKRMNMWYQSDLASHASNEEEMDEVRRQAEAETAEVIVCLQEELGILQQQVHNSNLKEIETEGRLVVLQTELKALQGNYEVMTQNNKSLGEKLEEKQQQLNTLSEEFESVISEIKVVLGGGDEALKDASNQVDVISGSFPQKRTWLSEQLGRTTRSISEKDLLIEELNHCLEDANARRNDMDSMLRTLRGAALVITEAHQQDCSEKEKEIILLKSQLSEKMLTIAKLEDRVKHGEEQLRKASNCATAAFVIVNRLSEINCDYLHALKNKDIQFTVSKEINMQKDVFLYNQAVEIDEREKQICSLRLELEMAEKGCDKLRVELSEEKKNVNVLERKLEEIEENNILKTKEKFTELKEGISTLKSCISVYAEKVGSPQKDIIAGGPVCKLSDYKCEARTGTGEFQGINNQETYALARIKTDISESSIEVGENLQKHSSDQKTMPFGRILNDASGRAATVALLKKEIESSLESLKVLQIEMARLCDEKEEVRNSEKRSRQGIESLMSQMLVLQACMGNFEEQVGLQMVSLDHKLRMVEKTTEEFVTSWIVKNESYEHELSDAKMIAAQKTAETSCILSKFEEAQDTIEEADILVNELMIANEINKLEIEGMKKERVVLINERDILANKVQSLQSSNNQKDQYYENLENQFESEVIAMKGLVQEVEDIVSQVQNTFKEDFMSISSDFLCLKSQLYDSTKLMQSWVEDLWSKIIVKDCVLSVLHLCHMGILLETVTGLNAENGLLHHGLCESNSLLFELREHNFKSRRDLEMCRVVEGKLLADIKNSFDRISRKEDETGQLTIKLTSFEKKILNLQLQEDLMLQRSNYMGSELAMLTKELNSSNRNVLASLLDWEKLLKDKEDVLGYQEEKFLIDLCAKDFELLVLASELEQMAAQNAKLENEQIGFLGVLDKLKKDMVLLNLDAELKEWILLDNEVEVIHLGNEIEVAKTERHDILSELNQRNLEISEMKEAKKAFEQEIKLLKEVACSNDTLKKKLTEVTEEKARMLFQVQKLDSECEKSLKGVKMKETSLEICNSHISILDQQNQMLQSDISLLETSLCTLHKELDIKKEELTEMRSLKEENEAWKSKLTRFKAEYCSILQDLEEKKSEIESSLSGKEAVDKENHRLQDDIYRLESCISNLQTELASANVELNQLRLRESALKDALCSKTHDLQIHVNEVYTFKEENVFLMNKLRSHKENKREAFSTLSLKFKKCSESVEVVDMMGSRVFNVLNGKIVALEKMFQEGASKFIEEFESLEIFARDLISENLALQSELERKDHVQEGLLFDLRLLQESASNNKDQKDEIEELLDSLEALENELSKRSSELDEAVGKGQILEVQLQEKIDIISTLELDISRQHEYVKSLSCVNVELTTNITNALQEKGSIEEELTQIRKDNENLELELLEMGTALEQMNNFIESLNNNLNSVTCERDEIHAELVTLKREFEMAKALAEENEVIAIEARQVAETRKLYADDKEQEVTLLERSVEELECTVNVLESKVDIVKGEAELQRLQRQELELELHAVKEKMHNVESGEAEMKRGLIDKEKSLHEALQHIQILEREIAAKDTEIGKCKAHISELNLHAEAQACEYKQKFKALEVMAEQVKCEGPAIHTTNSSINKLEKNGSRARGSGSPFKCIGLGLVQQIKSERDDELTAGRLRIEELETLAANRQKEIFMLNSRLASAESMTHDVLRDLLGLKSDITGYASLLDNKQVQKITEEARLHNAEVQVKDQEVIKLKQQLSEFVEERKGWLEEIDRKQAEMVAAQIALEKLQQQDRLLTAENEMFKMENINHKKKVMELEAEVKKLSGQQNIQQRIHHHAKIREENYLLKTQNEDLCSKLHRTEALLSHVKEELSHFRVANGRSPLVDKEQQLSDKLKETEEERMQLTHNLLALCTSILKAAGVTRTASNISLSEAEEALGQLKDRANILERELQESKLKNRISQERNRLAELMPRLQSSSQSLWADGSRRLSAPNRVFHNPCFSTLDR